MTKRNGAIIRQSLRPRSRWPQFEESAPIGEGVARGLRLRHDHGSNYLADDFQQEVAFFGIESSPSSCGSPKATASRNASSAH